MNLFQQNKYQKVKKTQVKVLNKNQKQWAKMRILKQEKTKKSIWKFTNRIMIAFSSKTIKRA